MPRTCLWADAPDAFTAADPRIAPIPDTGCWVWMGAMRSKNSPYGAVMRRGKLENAHRAFYQEVNGQIDRHTHLHHVCYNQLCVNPDHLAPMTIQEHIAKHGLIGNGLLNKMKSECPKCGGQYTLTKNGTKQPYVRRCISCTNERRRERNLTSI
jgi:hypothetical protein